MEQPMSGTASSLTSNFSQSSNVQEHSGGDNESDRVMHMEQLHGKSAPVAIGPERLTEVLNKKRMELLHSPEVRDFLRQQQSKLSDKIHCSDLKSKKDSSDSDTSDSQKSDPSNLSSPNR